MLEAETGDFLGKHRGFWFYTIGQRQGLRLPGGPWYACVFVLSYNCQSKDKYEVGYYMPHFRNGAHICGTYVYHETNCSFRTSEG